MMVPLPPDLGRLRLASPDDILRLGVVCTAGFFYSEQFAYERKQHQEYPQDTIVFFRHEVEAFVRSRRHVVLLALDKYDPDESEKTDAVIPESNGWSPPAAGEETVVGLAVWKLEPHSKRHGEFQNDKGTYPDLPKYQRRDLDQKRSDSIAAVAEAAETKYFKGLSSMERIVVHPAYWKKGHGSTLAKWGIELAKIDQVDQGVLATRMGSNLFKYCGFRLLTTVHVVGDEIDPEGVDLDVLKYETSG